MSIQAIMSHPRSTLAALTLLSLLGSGCSGAGCGQKQVSLPGDKEVLVQVNGTPISRYDLDRALRDTLSQRTLAQLDDGVRKRVLESLAQARAIAQVQDKTLDPEQRAELDKKVAAYREELLVKQYLAQHTKSQTVSEDQIVEYYTQHPDEFGASRVRNYELLTTSAEPTPLQRPKLIEAFGKLEREPNWEAAAQKLSKAGQGVSLRRGRSDEARLHPKLSQWIAQLQVGAPSQLTFIEGRPYLVRVSSETYTPPRPLALARSEIRTLLLPGQLKDAVKQASDQVLKSAEVAYR